MHYMFICVCECKEVDLCVYILCVYACVVCVWSVSRLSNADSLKLWQCVSELKQFIEPCIQLLPVGLNLYGTLYCMELWIPERKNEEWEKKTIYNCACVMSFSLRFTPSQQKRIDITICRGFPESNPNNFEVDWKHKQQSNYWLAGTGGRPKLSIEQCLIRGGQFHSLMSKRLTEASEGLHSRTEVTRLSYYCIEPLHHTQSMAWIAVCLVLFYCIKLGIVLYLLSCILCFWKISYILAMIRHLGTNNS